jgi:hypothetical protein
MSERERELAAVDAALAGQYVTGEHEPLAELTQALRAQRAQPSEEFARSLDARAAEGFPRRRRRPLASRRRSLIAGSVTLAATAVTVAVFVVSGTLKSGGGSAQTAQAPAAASGAARADHMGTAGPESAPARQVERTSTLDVGVSPAAMRTAAQRVFTLVSAFGGYVNQSSVSLGSVGQGGGASFDVRVPSANLASAIAALAHLGHVRSETDTTNDVTEQYDSLQRSLADLRAERSSLLRQLAAASEETAAATLKARLHGVETRIAQVQGSLRALTKRIDYTQLALSLTPEAAAGASSGALTPGAAAGEAAHILTVALAVLVIALAAVLPVALVVLAAWMPISLTRRRSRARARDAG